MRHDSQGWASVRYWQPPVLDWSFFFKCVLVRLVITLGPFSVLVSLRQGIPALIVLALSGLPWRRRVRASGDGLEVRHLFVSTVIPLAEVEEPSLQPDPRRVLGNRETILLLRRRSGVPLMLFAPLAILTRLCEQLRSQRGER